MNQYRVSDLATFLKDEGIISARTHRGAKENVFYWIKTGKLKPRRSANGWYVFNDKEIRQIAKAFDVGGSFNWSASPKRKI